MNTIRYILVTLTACSFVAGLSGNSSELEIGKILESYFTVHNELAADNLDRAQSAATIIAREAKVAGELDEVVDAAKSVAEAEYISTARIEFQGLSTWILDLVETVGTEGEPVYLARCPMAFDGGGGTWLQDNKTIANPYYGSMMLRCGSVTKEIGGGTAMEGTYMPSTRCCPIRSDT